ncbi:unnamed protein product [Timema podura]|uniref:Uncharacterized protein n=1 Tax=Timema podura TaxID=61482 RepID=A0ABN7NY89_TIMPD|nr:unnamed protein product [Timema podura]
MDTCDTSIVKEEIVELIKTEPQNEDEFEMCEQSGIKSEQHFSYGFNDNDNDNNNNNDNDNDDDDNDDDDDDDDDNDNDNDNDNE